MKERVGTISFAREGVPPAGSTPKASCTEVHSRAVMLNGWPGRGSLLGITGSTVIAGVQRETGCIGLSRVEPRGPSSLCERAFYFLYLPNQGVYQQC